MTDRRADDRPPLHEIDAHHAATLESIRSWVGEVYPSVVSDDPDRTKQWFEVSVKLFEIAYSHQDLRAGVALLAEMSAELLLAHAEHISGRDAL